MTYPISLLFSPVFRKAARYGINSLIDSRTAIELIKRGFGRSEYNSTYIRVGEGSLLKKVGFYCSECDIYYDLKQKPYTANETEKSQILPPFYKIREPCRDLDPGPLPYQG